MCVFLVLDIQPHVHGRMDGGVYLSNSRGTFFLKKKELGSSLPDGVASPETNPLRDGTVLLLSFGKLLLGAERLVALFHISSISTLLNLRGSTTENQISGPAVNING